MSYYFSRGINATFGEAIARTKEALSKHGFGVLSEIDVAATMKSKLSADMPPYVILGACSPRHAFRALQAEPHVGSMLPCNVIVREDASGKVEVAAVDPIASMQAVDNPTLSEVAREVQSLLRAVVADI